MLQPFSRTRNGTSVSEALAFWIYVYLYRVVLLRLKFMINEMAMIFPTYF